MKTTKTKIEKKAPKKRGRKKIISEAIINQIVSYLSSGATHKLACQAAGIAKPTFYRWLQLAEQGNVTYKPFYEAVKKAEAEGALKHLQNIEKHSMNDWRASGWLLERKWHYRKDSPVEVPKEEEQKGPPNLTSVSSKQILQNQYIEISKAAEGALKEGSYQAFAALKRQELKVALELRAEENKEGDGLYSDLDDNQILIEIEGLIASLPPVIKQKLQARMLAK